MCPDFIPNRENEYFNELGLPQYYPTEERETIRVLRGKIDIYERENKELRKEIDRLREKDNLIQEGCRIIRKFASCITMICFVLVVIGVTEQSLKLLTGNPELISNANVPEISGILILVFFIIGALLSSIFSSKFIDGLVRIYALKEEK